MLLRQASLETLNNRLLLVRSQLLKKAMKVYGALEKLLAAVERLHEMIEVNEYSTSLSPEYIHSLKNDPAISRVRARVQEISDKVAQSALVQLVEKTARLIARFSGDELVSKARFLDAFRNPVIKQIQETVDAHETKQFRAGKIKTYTQAHGKHLYFPGMFEAMPFPLLLQYANEVMWEAKNHEVWKSFLQNTTFGKQRLSDYIQCDYWYISKKGYYLTIAPGKAAFIQEKLVPAEEKGFAVHVNAVDALMTTVGIQDDLELEEQLDLGEADLLDEIKSCQRGIETLHGKFLEVARVEVGNNTYLLNKLDEELKTLGNRIQVLEDETKALQQLLAEQDILLADVENVRLGDVKKYEDSAQKIQQKNGLIQARREAVENAKRVVSESVRLAKIFDEEKQEGTHRGTRYAEMKNRYLTNMDPVCKKALSDADPFLLQADNTKNVKFLTFIQHLKKSRQEAVDRQHKLEILPEYALTYVPLASQCNELELACNSHIRLRTLLVQKSKEVSATMSSLEEKDVSLEKLQNSMAYFHAHAVQGAELKKKLDESRVATAKRFEAIAEQQKKVSQQVRDSKGYQELETGIAASRESFLANAITQDIDVQLLISAPATLGKKIKSKQNQLLNQLLDKLNILFNHHNMEALWQTPAGFVMFGHAKVNVGAQGVPRMISVPVEIHDAIVALGQIVAGSSQADQTRVARDVCLKIKTRMSKYGKEKKLLTPVYLAVCDFLVGKNDDLVVTEEKLAKLAKIIDTKAPSLNASVSPSFEF